MKKLTHSELVNIIHQASDAIKNGQPEAAQDILSVGLDETPSKPSDGTRAELRQFDAAFIRVCRKNALPAAWISFQEAGKGEGGKAQFRMHTGGDVNQRRMLDYMIKEGQEAMAQVEGAPAKKKK